MIDALTHATIVQLSLSLCVYTKSDSLPVRIDSTGSSANWIVYQSARLPDQGRSLYDFGCHKSERKSVCPSMSLTDWIAGSTLNTLLSSRVKSSAPVSFDK